ncbi:MAG: hypothetical protein R2762_09210 [Bryobacteraceae bacterium]
MASGPAVAFSRRVVWGHSCAPASADPDTVYVFDAREDEDGLPSVRQWLGAVPCEPVPLVAVIAPKPDQAMTVADAEGFEAALASLWAYPLARPDGDVDLLGYVRGLLPDMNQEGGERELSPEPDYSIFGAESADDFERAAARIVRAVPLHERID